LVELEALQENLERFKTIGAAVIALCPQLPEHNSTIVDQLGLEFPVLQDRNNVVASTLNLTLPQPPEVIEAEQFLGLDLPTHNGTGHWDLPIPARFVFDRSSKVLYSAIHIDHRTRRHPLECLESLQGVSSD